MKIGVAGVQMSFPDGLGLAGYGPLAGAGRNDPGDDERPNPGLWARAMVIEADGKRVWLAFVDLWAGSLRVQRDVVDRLRSSKPRPVGDLAPQDANVLILPSHTHSGPGHFSGNRVFDVLAQRPTGYREDVAKIIADALVEAFKSAANDMVPATLAVVPVNAYGLGRNRSMEAFVANFDHRAVWPPSELEIPAGGDKPTGREAEGVDPRMQTVWAFTAPEVAGAEQNLIGTFAVAGVHNAALGREHKGYHPDWAGLAARSVMAEAKLGWREGKDPWAAVAQGPAGDVTAIPALQDMYDMGLELAEKTGAAVAARWTGAKDEADRRAKPATLDFGYYRWRPADLGLSTWDIGTPALNGSEESRSCWWDARLGEARRAHRVMGVARRAFERISGAVSAELAEGFASQRPKDSALGVAQPVLRRALGLTLGEEHPIHLVRLGGHVFFGLPCEVTTVAAWQIERALLGALPNGDRWAVTSASPLAMVNDYLGYVTTAAEYDVQCYEGAMNLFGRGTLDVLRRMIVATARGEAGFDVDRSDRAPLPEVLSADEIEGQLSRAIATASAPVRWLLGALAPAPPTPKPEPAPAGETGGAQ